MSSHVHAGRRLLAYVPWVIAMAAFFAEVEIQIEGGSGWAASLPTWRIDQHWLLDIFWGGRPMTGYHAWVFSFMALVFFSPLAFLGRMDRAACMQALGGLSLFWVVEDALWFVFNPAFGWERFSPAYIPWHKHWWLGAPPDYWVGTAFAILMFVGVCKVRGREALGHVD